jgi:hypothetical protein
MFCLKNLDLESRIIQTDLHVTDQFDCKCKTLKLNFKKLNVLWKYFSFLFRLATTVCCGSVFCAGTSVRITWPLSPALDLGATSTNVWSIAFPRFGSSLSTFIRTKFSTSLSRTMDPRLFLAQRLNFYQILFDCL